MLFFLEVKKSHLCLSSWFRSSLTTAHLGFYPRRNTWFPFRRAGPSQTPILSLTAGQHRAGRLLQMVGELHALKTEAESLQAEPTQQHTHSPGHERHQASPPSTLQSTPWHGDNKKRRGGSTTVGRAGGLCYRKCTRDIHSKGTG